MILSNRYMPLSLAVLLCIFSHVGLASKQTVTIVSDKAKFEQATGQATYQGSVKLTEQNHSLLAENLIVYKNKQGELVKVIADGDPATFFGQMPNDEELVHAEAAKITLYPKDSLLKLSGKAKIRYKNDTFDGPLLDYHFKEHMIVANSQKNERPSITLETPKISKDAP
jgi:lipopolysaccharide export system protein LptA